MSSEKTWDELRELTDTMYLGLDETLEVVRGYRKALELIQSQAGLPDPAEACRAILKTASLALEKKCLYCPACRETGAIHCANPDECGEMKLRPISEVEAHQKTLKELA